MSLPSNFNTTWREAVFIQDGTLRVLEQRHRSRSLDDAKSKVLGPKTRFLSNLGKSRWADLLTIVKTEREIAPAGTLQRSRREERFQRLGNILTALDHVREYL